MFLVSPLIYYDCAISFFFSFAWFKNKQTKKTTLILFIYASSKLFYFLYFDRGCVLLGLDKSYSPFSYFCKSYSCHQFNLVHLSLFWECVFCAASSKPWHCLLISSLVLCFCVYVCVLLFFSVTCLITHQTMHHRQHVSCPRTLLQVRLVIKSQTFWLADDYSTSLASPARDAKHHLQRRVFQGEVSRAHPHEVTEMFI